MMRHGQSLWNKMNLFTGWVDIPLSEEGIQEALEAGKRIRDIPVDVIVTSSLVRAQMTAFLAMSSHSSGKVPMVKHPEEGNLEKWSKIHSKEAQDSTIPVYCYWELNERMYGELQGLNKAETAAKYGADRVQIWRRSYDVPPPNGESLEMTAARSIPCFKERVLPLLESGKNVFISAHGNSLRSIVMMLEGLGKDEVLKLEIPTGIPLFYEFQNGIFTNKR